MFRAHLRQKAYVSKKIVLVFILSFQKMSRLYQFEKKKRQTNVTRMLHVPMNVDPIHASASLGTWEVDITVASQPRDPARKSANTTAVAEAIGLIQMAREGWHHLLCTVIWMTKRVLARQSSVTILRAGSWWEDTTAAVVACVAAGPRTRQNHLYSPSAN